MDSIIPIDPQQETVFPGYSFLDDGTLQPSFDKDGQVLNANIVLTPNLVCDVCAVVIRNVISILFQDGDFDPVPFHTSKSKLRRSLLQGCHLCAQWWAHTIRYILLHDTGDNCNTIDSLFASSQVVMIDNEFGLRIAYPDGTTSRQLLFGNEKVNVVPDFSEAAGRAMYSASNASKENWEIATVWLERCVSEHEQCSDIQSSISRPPTRLIDVGCGRHASLRLVYPESKVSWIAVSHCWGKNHDQIKKLTKNTLNEMRCGFSEQELPQLFRDCITVTRRLGLRYIWLDSLCIIQDCSEDWSFEAGRMADVYRGSYCTIAAVSALDCHASLFAKCHPLISNEYTINGPLGSHDIGLSDISIHAEPLYKRAWVMQERLLSPRTLEYTNTGIRWRCSQIAFKLQDEIHGTQNFSLSTSWNYLLDLDVLKLSAYRRKAGQNEWTRLLNAYNSAKLTYETDRIHAFQGIVSTVQRETGLTMVAGVCEQFLPYSLLWRVEDTKRLNYEDTPLLTYDSWRNSRIGSPSWSCAFRHRYLNCGLGETTMTCAEASFKSHPEPILTINGRHMSHVTIRPITRGNKVRASFDIDVDIILQSVGYRWISVEDFLPDTGLILCPDFILQRSIQVDLVLLELIEEVNPLERWTAVGLMLARFEPGLEMWERVGVFYAPAPCLERGELLACFGDDKEYRVR